jgi:hypothetical protein
MTPKLLNSIGVSSREAMNLPELTRQSLALLRRILGQAPGPIAQEDPRWAFIFRHGRNICELGDDVLALEGRNRSRASRILVRPMMESLFNLAAAVRDRAFAAEKYVAELEDHIERIKKWIESDGSDQFQAEIDEAERRAHDTRRRYSVTTKNKWSVFDAAREAGLDHNYGRVYAVYSKHIHSANSALIASELELDRELVLKSVFFIFLKASEHLASAAEAGPSQTLTGEIAELCDTANKLIKS